MESISLWGEYLFLWGEISPITPKLITLLPLLLPRGGQHIPALPSAPRLVPHPVPCQAHLWHHQHQSCFQEGPILQDKFPDPHTLAVCFPHCGAALSVPAVPPEAVSLWHSAWSRTLGCKHSSFVSPSCRTTRVPFLGNWAGMEPLRGVPGGSARSRSAHGRAQDGLSGKQSTHPALNGIDD